MPPSWPHPDRSRCSRHRPTTPPASTASDDGASRALRVSASDVRCLSVHAGAYCTGSMHAAEMPCTAPCCWPLVNPSGEGHRPQPRGSHKQRATGLAGPLIGERPASPPHGETHHHTFSALRKQPHLKPARLTTCSWLAEPPERATHVAELRKSSRAAGDTESAWRSRRSASRLLAACSGRRCTFRAATAAEPYGPYVGR